MDCRYLQTVDKRKIAMRTEFKDVPLSKSSVSLKLSEIQKRCSELILDSEALADLTLEPELPVTAPDRGDPYNRG